MQKFSNNFKYKTSIENDMSIHAEQLSFLDQYKIDSVEYDANGVRIYKLSFNEHTCLLEVIHRDTSNHAAPSAWETENYLYRILTKDE